MKIIFEQLSFKNVFSYGNKVTVFKFENGIDLITGKNGNGKSSFVDALTYALFGKPFRKIKLGSLINDKNNKELWVELIFSVNENRFKIERGQKPDVFKIFKQNGEDWEMIDQHSRKADYQKYLEENILHISDTVFRQLIALGANLDSSKGFMDLTKKEKEEVLQVITDTAIFAQIQEKIRERKNTLKTQIIDVQYQEQLLESSFMSANVNIQQLERQNAEFRTNRDDQIAEIQSDIEERESKLPQLEAGLQKIEELKAQREELMVKKRPYTDALKDLQHDRSSLVANAKVLIENEKSKVVCSECGHENKQSLPFTQDGIKADIVKVDERMAECQRNIDELNMSIQELDTKIYNEPRIRTKKDAIESELPALRVKLERVRSWEETVINYDERDRLHKEYKEAGERLVKLREKQSDLNALENLVGDNNIKGMVLNQQLPFLNKFINEFLELFESKFNFVINDQFEDNIISRSTTNEFNALSNGQKQRITMSVLFAFLKLIEERNGVSTNLLILDEYLDSSLDVDGINEVLKILSEVFSPNKNVVLISHNPDIKNRFELLNRSISILQVDGFSAMDIERNGA